MSVIMQGSPYENVATAGSRTMAHRARLVALLSPQIPVVDLQLKALLDSNGNQIFPAGHSTTETEFRRQFEARAEILDTCLRIYENALNAEIGGTAGVAGGQLVFAPNNPNPGPGVYTNWADLYAAFQLTRGLVDIYFDYQYGDFGTVPVLPAEYAIFPVPAGAYDFERRAVFRGIIASALCIVLPEAGTTFVGLRGISGGVGVFNTTPDPIILLGEIAAFLPEIFFMEFGATLGSDVGAAPVLTMGNGPSLQSVVGLSTANIINAGAPAIGIVPGGIGILYAVGPSEVAADSVQGDGTTGFFVILGASSSNVDLVNQANFLGTLLIQLLQVAPQIGYGPTTPGDWGSAVPDDVGEALDILAANTVIP